MDSTAFAGCMGRGTQHEHVDNSVPGDVLVFSLVLIMISASICTSRKGLQGRVMEAYVEWSSQLKKEKKKKRARKKIRSL